MNPRIYSTQKAMRVFHEDSYGNPEPQQSWTTPAASSSSEGNPAVEKKNLEVKRNKDLRNRASDEEEWQTDSHSPKTLKKIQQERLMSPLELSLLRR